MTARPILLLLLLLSAAWPAAAERPLTVFAAASLGPAVEAAAGEFADGGGAVPRIVLGSSGALSRQLMHGAPGDLFLSASPVWAEMLEGEGLVGPPRVIARNRLVVVAPAGARAPSARAALERVGPRGRLALPDPGHAPLGQYAREALESLGLWERLEGRITASPDAVAALALVAWGQARLGIAYASQLGLSAKIEPVAALDPASHSPIVYLAAVLREGERRAEAERFLAFLAGPGGQAILVANGFLPWRD